MAPRDVTSGPGPTPEFELELDERPAAAPRRRLEPADEPQISLELAVDSRALVRERAGSTLATSPATSTLTGVHDVSFDARLLGDYGDPPAHWFLSPLYALRVFRRRRTLMAALAGRREESARAAGEVEAALVAFAERARGAAEQREGHREGLEQLSAAEELLRSRDRSLASEQDAQNARLSQVDARLSSLEAQLAYARAEESALAADLSASQEALAREESRLKRAEIELRSVQQRGAGEGTVE